MDYFKKLNVSNTLELSLLIPKSYEDYTIKQRLVPKTYMVVDATVESVEKTPKTLQIKLFSHNFGHKITAVFFKTKPYLYHQFKVYERLYLYGRIECSSGFCQIVVPKKISSNLVGEIVPVYKNGIRGDFYRRFLKEHLTLTNLLKEGLKEDVAKDILSIHFPKQLPQKLSHKQLFALKYTEIFNYLKKLSSKKTVLPSKAVKTNDINKWLKTLPFDLTEEQLKAIKDIQKDLQRDIQARRMIVGDVGSGKSMVMFATAYLNHPNKTVLMAPTTILANQLYNEAKKFLPDFKTVLLTNKTKKTDLNEFDFIIGTHALLYKKLPNATVVMVDEQHRFGTTQRNMLQHLVSEGKLKPHFFQFSATPIPRTQAMIESAQIDVTLITTTPFKKDITTKVISKKDFKNLLAHINNEINSKHQILIIYPLVEESQAVSYQSIDEARSYWEKNFKNVYVTHGKDKEKETILEEFKDKGDILLATTVVEVGISLPRLSTIVIVGAERLGLATLHQLRGRVSRNGLKGYCFLYTNNPDSKRLDAFCKTTNGFEIAKLDLKFRDSGDLLSGKEQSGKHFKFLDLVEDEGIIKQAKNDLGI